MGGASRRNQCTQSVVFFGARDLHVPHLSHQPVDPIEAAVGYICSRSPAILVHMRLVSEPQTSFPFVQLKTSIRRLLFQSLVCLETEQYSSRRSRHFLLLVPHCYTLLPAYPWFALISLTPPSYICRPRVSFPVQHKLVNMPVHSTSMASRRDSWPPTQVRLVRTGSNKGEPRPLLDNIDQDPLTYFLTPEPGDEDDDFISDSEDDDDDMDYDAGIENTSSPREITRSVSPSSLEGLHKPAVRSPSPEFDSDGLTSDDDDVEDFIRFSPPPRRSSLFSRPENPVEAFGFRSRSPVFGTTSNGFLSPASYPGPSTRGRSTFSPPRRSMPRAIPGRARPVRLWREPSPDVWSIEEETEEDLLCEMENSLTVKSDSGLNTARKAITIPSAKPKKQVRFALEVEEVP